MALILASVSLVIAGVPETLTAKPAFTLRIATLAPMNSPMGKAYRELNAGLKARTDGQASVLMYGGGAAGDEKTIVRKMRVGQIDGAMLTAIGLGALVRQILVLQAPGLIENYGELDRVREELRGEIEALFDKAGYTLIGWGDVGRVRLFSTHRIETPDDLKKVRPWTWRDSLTTRVIYDVIGANAVPVGVPEVYPALQTGMIDTLFSSSIAVVGLQWHSRLKTMTDPPYGVVVGAFVIRKDKLAALPKAGRDFIFETARDTEGDFRQQGRIMDEKATRALMKRLVVVDLTKNSDRWLKVAKEARDSLAGRLYSRSLLDRVEKIVAQHKASRPHAND